MQGILRRPLEKLQKMLSGYPGTSGILASHPFTSGYLQDKGPHAVWTRAPFFKTVIWANLFKTSHYQF